MTKKQVSFFKSKQQGNRATGQQGNRATGQQDNQLLGRINSAIQQVQDILTNSKRPDDWEIEQCRSDRYRRATPLALTFEERGSARVLPRVYDVARNPQRNKATRALAGSALPMLALYESINAISSLATLGLTSLDLLLYTPLAYCYYAKKSGDDIFNLLQRRQIKEVLRALNLFMEGELYVTGTEFGDHYKRTVKTIPPKYLPQHDEVAELLTSFLNELTSAKSEHWQITHDLNCSNKDYRALMQHAKRLALGGDCRIVISTTKESNQCKKPSIEIDTPTIQVDLEDNTYETTTMQP